MNKNTDNIIITGAHENNLRNISLEIPKGELVVFCGVSGSGKLPTTTRPALKSTF